MSPALASGMAALALIAAAASAPVASAAPVATRQPIVTNAIDGVFAAFREHPVVGLSDAHGLAQAGAFYAALVRDPRFAREVGNVVVEFGGAAHQETIDRYVNGEDIPYAELRKVWTDLVGWERLPSQMYSNFFASLRAANADLPPAQRIRVWLGEPPIDWSAIRTLRDLDPYMAQRDSYPARLVDQILDRRGKTLIIYGGLHFYMAPGGEPAIKQILERRHPGAVFVASVYAGYPNPACVTAFEANTGTWPQPALATPISGTWLEATLRRPACVEGPRFVRVPTPPDGPGGPPLAAKPGAPQPRPSPELMAALFESRSGVGGDGLLFLGPAASLTTSPVDQSLYLDAAYAREIARRERMWPLPPPSANEVLDGNTSAASPYHPR